MRFVRDWPFSGERLQLAEREKRTLMAAARIAEKAAAQFPPDSAAWVEWKRLEYAARECAEC